MSANSIFSTDTSPTDKQIEPISSLLNKPQAQEETFALLPRSAWNSQLVYFRIILKAKLNLDRAEREALEAARESTAK